MDPSTVLKNPDNEPYPEPDESSPHPPNIPF
jgi:hypothetical protein